MENKKISQENYLAKNIKKILLIVTIMVVVLVILAIVDSHVNILDRLAQATMAKLMR